jgi:hypothetical protein
VLLVDGGAVSLTALAAPNAYSDLNSNDCAERTGWVNAGDGLLELYANRNDRIDNGSELFGSARENGFTVLARYDLRRAQGKNNWMAGISSLTSDSRS